MAEIYQHKSNFISVKEEGKKFDHREDTSERKNPSEGVLSPQK